MGNCSRCGRGLETAEQQHYLLCESCLRGEQQTQTLVEWLSDGNTPVCRFLPSEDEAPTFLVRTSIGAEPVFALIDTDSDSDDMVTYLDVKQLVDVVGMHTEVQPMHR